MFWLKEQIGKKSEIAPDQIKSTDSIAQFGIDSVILVTISVDLEAYAGKEIDPTIL